MSSYISLIAKDQQEKQVPLSASASNPAVKAVRASAGSSLIGNNKVKMVLEQMQPQGIQRNKSVQLNSQN